MAWWRRLLWWRKPQTWANTQIVWDDFVSEDDVPTAIWSRDAIALIEVKRQ